MFAFWRRLSRLLSREILILCAIIFLADVIAGLFIATFSLFAASEGASLTQIGTINTLGGLVQLALSLPIGMLTDRIGRKWVFCGGSLLFLVSLLILGGIGGIPMLFLGRILFSIAGIAAFQIGATYLGDITTPEQRTLAYGILTTAMGLGFAVGPLMAGLIAEWSDLRTAYLSGAVVAVFSLVASIIFIREVPKQPQTAFSKPKQSGQMWQLLRQPDLVVVTFGYMLINLTFAGAISTFFPLYAEGLLISQATIASMFAIRAIVSTLGRLPNSLISRKFGTWSVILGALILNIVAMFGMALSQNYNLLIVFLAIEGLAYGAYMVAGQTYVADHTTVDNRGTAMGIYATAAAGSGALAPLALGLVANAWGIEQVFTVTAWLLVAGLIVALAGVLSLKRKQPKQQPNS